MSNMQRFCFCYISGGTTSSWIPVVNTVGSVWEEDVAVVTGTERVTVVAKVTKEKSTTYSSVLEYKVINKVCNAPEYEDIRENMRQTGFC